MKCASLHSAHESRRYRLPLISRFPRDLCSIVPLLLTTLIGNENLICSVLNFSCGDSFARKEIFLPSQKRGSRTHTPISPSSGSSEVNESFGVFICVSAFTTCPLQDKGSYL